MIGLYALACHFAGDWLLQSNRMAEQKLADWRIRAEHCAVYTFAFLPFVVATGWSVAQGAVFAALLFSTHLAIDSRRWCAPRPGFVSRPIWFDQVLHIVTLALIVAIVDGGWSA